jgi:Transposase DDE domain
MRIEAMELKIIAIYCLLDDYILSIGHKDWPNVRLSTAEVMLIYVIGMKFFYGNVDTARIFLMEHGYISNRLSKSGLNKRIHKIPTEYWEGTFEFMQRLRNKGILPLEYIVDAFPVSVCRNIRIRNCRIYQGEEFRGYNVSKREWFYGLKVTVIATCDGCPLRVILCPGSEHDSVPFKLMDRSLPHGSEIYGLDFIIF